MGGSIAGKESGKLDSLAGFSHAWILAPHHAWISRRITHGSSRLAASSTRRLWDPGEVDTDVIETGLPFAHAVGVTGPDQTLLLQGDACATWPFASVSKPIAALATLIAIDRGLLDLDDEAGPPGATVHHLLAHAAGYPFEGDEPIAEPGARRIYSNTGFEVLAARVEEATGYDFPDWVEETVVGPLGLTSLDVDGSPAAGYSGSIEDLLVVGRELLRPTLIDPELAAVARTVQFPGLAGILPGYGRQKPNDWGLGFELRDSKSPHWTGSRSSTSTFGHFGQSGSFLWVDPEADLAAAFLGAEPFGPAHIEAWPPLTDRILERFAPPTKAAGSRTAQQTAPSSEHVPVPSQDAGA